MNNEKPEQTGMSRRNLLTTIGLTSAAVVAGGMLHAVSGEGTVAGAVYGEDEGGCGMKVRSVSTIADLVGLSCAVDGMKVAVTSYSDFSELGGGLFVYDAGVVRSLHNGVTIFSPTVPVLPSQSGTGNGEKLGNYILGTGETSAGSSGCWVRVGNKGIQRINFADAGIVPELDNIARPFRAISTRLVSGSVITMEPGNYTLAHDGLNIDPEGGTRTEHNAYLVLLGLNDMTFNLHGVKINIVDHNLDEDSITIIACFGCNRVVFDGLSIDMTCVGGRNDYGTRAMWFHFSFAADGTLCQNITVKNCPYLRAYHPLGGTPAGEGTSGTSQYSKVEGMRFFSDLDSLTRQRSIQFINNKVFDTTARTIWLWFAENFLISGNEFHDVGFPHTLRITTANQKGIISNNYMRARSEFSFSQIAITKQTVRADPKNIIITNNIFESGNNDAIRLYGASDVIIAENQFSNYPGYDGTLRSGILLQSDDGLTPTDVMIANNHFKGMNYHIYVSAAERLSIRGCKFVSAAGSAVGISGQGLDHTISDCEITSSTGFGISLSGCVRPKVDNVTFKSCAGDMILNSTVRASIKNCKFVGGTGRAISQTGTTAPTDTIVENNEFYDNTYAADQYLIRAAVSSTGNSAIRFNVFENNTAKLYGTPNIKSDNIVDGVIV